MRGGITFHADEESEAADGERLRLGQDFGAGAWAAVEPSEVLWRTSLGFSHVNGEFVERLEAGPDFFR